MKIIEQGGRLNRNLTIEIDDNGVVILTQSTIVDHDIIVVDKSQSRELALSICPELQEEIERMKENHKCALMVIHNNNLQSAYIEEQIKSK
jgi:hypothetical protein